MNELEIEGLVNVMNSFSTCILSNSGFEEHHKLSIKYGHKENMSKEQLLDIHNFLNNLKTNQKQVYIRMYKKLFSLILQDNLNGNKTVQPEMNGTPYALFSRVRYFTDCIQEMIELKNNEESICIRYEGVE